MNRWLSRRPLVIGLVVLVLLVSGVILWRWLSNPRTEPAALQIMARPTTQEVKIVVGPNVQASKANATIPHKESIIAADPSNPARLFLLAMMGGPIKTSVIGYLSEDSGATWHPSFERKAGPEEAICDPSLSFGPNGALFGLCLHINVSADDPHNSGRIVDFFCSRDGGKTWESASTIQRKYTDRPWLAVDATTGQYSGRLCCVSWGSAAGEPGHRSLDVDVSADQGKSFAIFHRWPIKGRRGEFMPGNPVILSDGTLAQIYRRWIGDFDERPQILLVYSSDGGQTLHPGSPVPTSWYDERLKTSNQWFFPQLAASPAGAAFSDRLYAVWEDGGALPERVRILFALSKDKGESWVGPTILSEQPATKDRDNEDYGAYMPSLAVNKDGVLAVTWYDRRGLSTGDGKGFPLGYNVRMRISLDGGETWQPSIQVNVQTIQSRCRDLGDTAGLAADADGVFHPVWIDDRTGTRQVWTARVKVE